MPAASISISVGARVHHSRLRRDHFHVREKVRPFDGLTGSLLNLDIYIYNIYICMASFPSLPPPRLRFHPHPQQFGSFKNIQGLEHRPRRRWTRIVCHDVYRCHATNGGWNHVTWMDGGWLLEPFFHV